MQNTSLCIHWDVPVAICLRLSECDERSSLTFGAAKAVYAHAYAHAGPVGAATATDSYSPLHNTNARAGGFSKCNQHAAFRAGVLLFMV